MTALPSAAASAAASGAGAGAGAGAGVGVWVGAAQGGVGLASLRESRELSPLAPLSPLSIAQLQNGAVPSRPPSEGGRTDVSVSSVSVQHAAVPPGHRRSSSEIGRAHV